MTQLSQLYDAAVQDLSANLQLLRPPRNKAAHSLMYNGISKFEASVFLVGIAVDCGPARLSPCARLDLLTCCQISNSNAVFGLAENLTNARYEEVCDCGADRSLYVA